MRIVLPILFLLLVHARLSAQDERNVRQMPVHHIEPAGLVISEPIERGMSLYGLSERYKVSIDAILAANPDLDPRAVPLGYPLAIPLDAAAITQQEPANDVYAIPLSYRVQPKETLYRIARVYLGSSPEAVLALNPNARESLAIGQVLHIGWYVPVHRAGAVPGPSTLPADVAGTEPTDYAEVYAREGSTILDQKGLAFWKPGSTEGHYFVLHPTARVGSYMEVTNPMLHRTVTAKVAGRLNAALYPKNVGLVVSPSLARALGVLDQQFFARWRYVE
jgi:LysM repeat protein